MSSIQEIQKEVQNFIEFAAPAPIKKKRVESQTTSQDLVTPLTKRDQDKWFPFPKDQEYDPGRPNDYEAIILERRKKKKEYEREVKLNEELTKLEKEREAGTSKLDLEVSAQQVLLNRSRKSKDMNSAEAKAKKMMERMGWRGSGLGKDEQGIVTPLIAKKHSNSSGKIVQSSLTYAHTSTTEGHLLPKRSVEFNRAPTRIVLLLNTMDPEEADEELGQEIGQECLKFGKVERVEIRVVEAAPKRLGVRVFILFDKTESAIKAMVDLGVRYFNGNPVFAFFFDEDAFFSDKLVPPESELKWVMAQINQ